MNCKRRSGQRAWCRNTPVVLLVLFAAPPSLVLAQDQAPSPPRGVVVSSGNQTLPNGGQMPPSRKPLRLSAFKSEPISVGQLDNVSSGDVTAGGIAYSRVAGLLRQWNLDGITDSVQIVTFASNVDHTGAGEGDVSPSLFGKGVQRGTYSQVKLRGDIPATAQGFRTDDGGAIYLGTTGRQVQGWAFMNGARYELRVFPDDLINNVAEPRHFLLRMLPEPINGETPPADYGSGHAAAGDVRSGASFPATMTTDSGAPGTPPDCAADARDVLGPLRLVVGYTPAADDEARSQRLNIELHVHLAAIALQDILRNARTSVRVEVVDPISEVQYQEVTTAAPQDEHVLQTMVNELATDTDPGLKGFRSDRQRRAADVGVLVVHQDGDEDCGWARAIGANRDDAYVVVNWKCILSKMSMAHEIGHLLGAYHEVAKAGTMPAYARAFMYDSGREPFVTIMGYERNCANTQRCVRIPWFSDPNEQWRGVHIGQLGKYNNACAVRAHIGAVVHYGGHPMDKPSP